MLYIFISSMQEMCPLPEWAYYHQGCKLGRATTTTCARASELHAQLEGAGDRAAEA